MTTEQEKTVETLRARAIARGSEIEDGSWPGADRVVLVETFARGNNCYSIRPDGTYSTTSAREDRPKRRRAPARASRDPNRGPEDLERLLRFGR